MDEMGARTRAKRKPLLSPVARLVTRRPRLVAIAWIAVMGVLALFGTGLESKVSTQAVYVAGSPAERAHNIAVREFGDEDTLVVMLRGPGPRVDEQGSALVSSLQKLPQTSVLSPWNAGGALKGLRPSPGVAALLVTVGKSEGGASSDTLPVVERTILETVAGPVRVSLAGGPAIVKSLRDSIARATTFGEKMALPALLIVLLLVCRSVLAAALPVVIGAFVAGATRGILDLLTHVMAIDSIALGTAGMLGLSLGVDYSLLMVARFREEIAKDGDIDRAVQTTVLRTGRAIIPAGCGLLLAMFVALELLPGSFIASIAAAAFSATLLSMLAAMFFAPAALALLGSRLNRWSLPRRRESGSMVMSWSRRVSARPPVVLGLLFALMLCAVWAFSLKTNVGVASLLPPDDPGRVAQEDIERELGPGWVAPFEIVMDGGNGPVTTPKRLDALADFQHKVEHDPGVAAMAGFASLKGATDALGSVGGQLAAQERGKVRLAHGLGAVQKGTAATVDGFTKAAAGATQLDTGAGLAKTGTGQLANGLQATADGSARLSEGLGKASEGTGKLSQATTKTSAGASVLAEKLESARKQSAEAIGGSRPLKRALRSGERSLDSAPLAATEGQLSAAWGALQRMTVGRGDPQFAAAVAAIREANKSLNGVDPESGEGEEEGGPAAGVSAGIQHALDQLSLAIYLARRQDKSQLRANEGIGKLAEGSAKLDRGLGILQVKTRELSEGMARLSAGGEALPPGLRRLTAGAEQLLGGLGRLQGGAESLAGGLGIGAQKSGKLAAGVGRMHAATEKAGGQGLNRLQEQSPGLFRSGYFFLAGLDGSPAEQRTQAGYLVNVAKGGSAARMLVIPTDPQATSGAAATGERLTADADRLARDTDGEVLVGGISPTLVELNSALRGQTPLARLILSIVTLIVLLPVTRSVPLSLLAVVFNLLTVSATFGLLSLLFNGSLLGGPGFVDAAVIPATAVLTFGLAIDYEVFILARMREEYLRTGSTAAAIADGLGKTAPVISGAAMIMVAVFLAFSLSPLAVLRNLGVALAIGVIIDAFVIRFVLLPAAMRALGDRCWWIPRWLDRAIPGGKKSRLAVEG